MAYIQHEGEQVNGTKKTCFIADKTDQFSL